MSVTSELFNLQEIDQELAAGEQARSRIVSELQGNPEIEAVRTDLQTSRSRQEEFSGQQRAIEHEIEEISVKLKKFDDELYSGKTTNTKELSGLQHEIELLQSTRVQLEDRELELMESIEQTDKSITTLTVKLQQLEAAWATERERLTGELNQIEETITRLRDSRDSAAARFDADAMSLYENLRQKRGTAVAKVTRGICQGCRIQLPVSELEQVRAGNLTRCGSCGRILLLS